MDYNEILKKSIKIDESKIDNTFIKTLIYDISETIKNGHMHMSGSSSYYYKVILEQLSKELPEIIFIKNTRNEMTTTIDASRVTDFELEEIVPGAYIVRFEIDYKKRIVRRISNIDSVINLKPLLEKLGRYDLLIKLY